MTNFRDLKQKVSSRELVKADAFGVLQQINAFRTISTNNAQIQEVVLRALDNRAAFRPFGSILDRILREQGLFPYLDQDRLSSLSDKLAYGFHMPLPLKAPNRVFHRPQARVFRELMQGRSIVLSAPTSFGKSLIIDALLLSGKFDQVVIVVPTIALIDETRKRIAKLDIAHKVITHVDQAHSTKNVFVFTQERVWEKPDFPPSIDLFVIDEFYKLFHRKEDPDERQILLNLALDKLSKIGKQFYMLGPEIKGYHLPTNERFAHEYREENFRTVVTETRTIGGRKSKQAKLLEILKEIGGNSHEPTIIFCSGPDRAMSLCRFLLDHRLRFGEGAPDMAIDWLGENYHQDWSVKAALRKGIAVHHGRLPRALAQYMVTLFNSEERKINLLICTSTLIEGVNTKARHIIIYDNRIGKKLYDFFTFNNIRGRAGRMKQHFIGFVHLLHNEPEATLPFGEIDVFAQTSETPTSLLVQLDHADLTSVSAERIAGFAENQYLSLDVIRKNSGISPEKQIHVAQAIYKGGETLNSNLTWTGMPKKEQLAEVFKLFWSFLAAQGGASPSEAQLNRFLAMTFNLVSQPSTRDLILKQLRFCDTVDEAVQSVFEFQRDWATFKLPRYIRAINLIQEDVYARMGLPSGDYDFFAGRLECMFLSKEILQLDEYGIPIEIGRKIEKAIQSDGNLDSALTKLKSFNTAVSMLLPFEKHLIEVAKDSISIRQ